MTTVSLWEVTGSWGQIHTEEHQCPPERTETCPMRRQEVNHMQRGRGSSSQLDHVGPDLKLPISRTGRDTFLSLIRHPLGFSVLGVRTDRSSNSICGDIVTKIIIIKQNLKEMFAFPYTEALLTTRREKEPKNPWRWLYKQNTINMYCSVWKRY